MTTTEFGPQGAEVAALLARAARLTSDEERRLNDDLWDSIWGRDSAAGAMGSAEAMMRHVAGIAAQDEDRPVAAARDAAWNAAEISSGGGDWAQGRQVVFCAAVALSLRDLIGQHGFTQEHYDHLTGPWRRVIGPIHPDDPALYEQVEREESDRCDHCGADVRWDSNGYWVGDDNTSDCPDSERGHEVGGSIR